MKMLQYLGKEVSQMFQNTLIPYSQNFNGSNKEVRTGTAFQRIVPWSLNIYSAWIVLCPLNWYNSIC